MKKLIFALVVLGLIYGALWYHGAQKAKDLVQEKISEASIRFEKDGFALTNEGVSVKGFPFHYIVEIKSPALKKVTDQDNRSIPLKSLSLDGHLSLISNFIGTKFSIEKQGDTNLQSRNYNESGSKIDEFIISGKSLLTFSVEEKSYLEAIKNPFKALFQAIEKSKVSNEFLVGKTGSLSLKDFKVVNVESPSISVFEMENGFIQYEIKEKEGKISFMKMDGDIRGMNLDTFILGSNAYTPGHERSLKEIALLLSMPKPGKTSIDFDVQLTGPLEKLENLIGLQSLDDLPPFSFDLKKLNVSTDFGQYTHKASLSFHKNSETDRHFLFNTVGTAFTSKADFERFKEQWGVFLDNLPVCQPNAENGQVNEACPLVKSLIPKMDEFGKIVGEIDLKFTVSNPVDILTNSKAVLNAFNYYSELYGLKSNGTFEFITPETSVGTYKIELLNYKPLFQDLFNYLRKLHAVLPLFNVQVEKLPKLSDENLNMILNYLKQVSDEPAKDLKDITITIKINGPLIQIGTLSQEEFIKKSAMLSQELSKDFTKKTIEAEEVIK
jgi:hypothetical protein